MRELEVLYADPEEEYARDVWDLRKLGLAQRNTRHVGLHRRSRQAWLREGAKEWARVKSMTYTQGTACKARSSRCGLLSESLARREDGGDEKTALNRADMRQFVERLGRLHRAGRLPEPTSTGAPQGPPVPARVPGVRAL